MTAGSGAISETRAPGCLPLPGRNLGKKCLPGKGDAAAAPSPCGLNTEKCCFLRAGQSKAGFVPWEIQSAKDLYFLEIFYFFLQKY